MSCFPVTIANQEKLRVPLNIGKRLLHKIISGGGIPPEHRSNAYLTQVAIT